MKVIKENNEWILKESSYLKAIYDIIKSKGIKEIENNTEQLKIRKDLNPEVDFTITKKLSVMPELGIPVQVKLGQFKNHLGKYNRIAVRMSIKKTTLDYIKEIMNVGFTIIGIRIFEDNIELYAKK